MALGEEGQIFACLGNKVEFHHLLLTSSKLFFFFSKKGEGVAAETETEGYLGCVRRGMITAIPQQSQSSFLKLPFYVEYLAGQCTAALSWANNSSHSVSLEVDRC